jgi:hypothetical protein
MTKPDESLVAVSRMSSAERSDLSKLVRIRARIARKEVGYRIAQLLANVEQQLAAQFSKDHKLFQDVTRKAEAVIKEADAEIAKRSREMGIPDAFRPSLQLDWLGRGENAFKERRRELRAVAETELEQRAEKAKLEIDRAEGQLLTQIMADGLTSAAAREFLTTMPTPEQLMPKLIVTELEQRVPLRIIAGPYHQWRDDD